MTVVEFVEARLAELEEAADRVDQLTALALPHLASCWSLIQRGGFLETPGDCDCGVPEVVLLRVAATRAILTLHDEDNQSGDCPTCEVPLPCPTVLAVASEWSTHPDYQPDWSLPA